MRGAVGIGEVASESPRAPGLDSEVARKRPARHKGLLLHTS